MTTPHLNVPPFEEVIDQYDAPVVQWPNPVIVYGCDVCGCIFTPQVDGEALYPDRFEPPAGCDDPSCKCHDIPRNVAGK